MGKKFKKNVPLLRFPEFSKPWLIKSVSALVKENFIYKPLDGNHGNLHPTSFDYVKSGIPFVMSNDIQDGVINYSKCHYISEDLARSLQKGFSKEGDVLLTHKGTVGEVAIVNKTAFPFIMLTPQVTYYRVKNPKLLSNLFLASLFISHNFQRMLKVLAAGGTRPYIGITEQGKLTISIPSLAEQEKIASFLGAIDTRLNQLRRKQELLQTYKRGIMQKLFSQELRFKQDDGSDFPDWEEKTLGEISKIKRGASPRPISSPIWFSTKSEIGWVRISDVTKSNKYLEETEQYLSEAGIKKSRFVPYGNLIMSICATIGKPIITKMDVCIHDGFVVFEKLQEDITFIYFLLTNIEVNWQKYGQPGIQVNLNTDIVSNESVLLPCLEEQEKIANFLTAIDRKIETLSRQIKQTEQFKKGLLQKMFV